MKPDNHNLALAAVFAFLAAFMLTAQAQNVLLEAEQFADPGGWDVDQQSMDQMGSPYLLAHGLGVPVKNAVTTAKFPAPGTYRVWVRTRDWVAPWKAPGAPGRFQLLVNGRPLATIFGTQGTEWHWQDGGSVEVGTEAKIALHDLTGFEGRCDAVLFAKDAAFDPPNELAALTQFRRAALALSEEPEDGGHYDLVVVGGGIAGTSAALSAARNGLKVALVQDRPVLGGNGSSEVRVWPEGKTRQKPYPHIGDIVEELVPPKTAASGNAKHGSIFDDERKLHLVRAEPRITLLTEQRMIAVEVRNGRIQSVVAQHTRSARRVRLSAKFFVDGTGDGTVGFFAGADYEISKEGVMGASNLWNLMDAADPAQVLRCECKDKDALTLSVDAGKVAAPFPRCPWAIDLTDKPFPGRQNAKGQWANTPLSNLGGWFWESGFDKDPINDLERIRDLNFRAMYGAWDALKNVDKLYPNHRLGWAAFIAGKRESRRLLGDVILTGDDFRKGCQFPDGCFPCSWHIDIHTPHPDYDQGHKGDEFIAQATTGQGYSYQGPYWAPYRCLYSRNITNLFMVGRDISVNREALGPVRVMRTCGMMGEVVGKAAWICVRHQTTPRGVYEIHLSLLKELMSQPGALRRDRLEGSLSLPAGAKIAARAFVGLDPATLEGIIIDDDDAELQGKWEDSGSLTGFVGENYRYSSDAKATARFPFTMKETGTYDVRVAWQPHANRAKAVPITVQSADGEKTITLDQTQPARGANGFQSIGTFRFAANQKAAVLYHVAGARGTVHIDAVQVVPAQRKTPDGATIHRDLAYVPGGHERQKLDLYLPKDGTHLPLIINIHGGAFKMGGKEQGVPLEYLTQGYAVASINYRLSQHAVFPAQIEDCKAAVRWLRSHAREYQLDPNRFAAWGGSAGGHLAAMLGTTGDTKQFEVGGNLDQSSRVQAVVDYFGPTDFLQMDAHRLPNGQVHDSADSPESQLVGGPIQQNQVKTAKANPITYVTKGDPPFLICHGDADPLVPHHQSELLEAALRQAGVPVTFYTVKGAGHGRFNDPKVPEITRAFLARELKKANIP